MIPHKLPSTPEHTRHLKGAKWARRNLSDAAKNTATVLKAAVLLPPNLHQKITTGTVIWIDPLCGQKRSQARAGHPLQTVAEPDAVEEMAPRDPRDIQFETIVNMFAEPIAFLLLAGRSTEEVAAFDDMRADDQDQYLMEAFVQDIAPTLPDRLLKSGHVLFGGERYTADRFAGKGCFGTVCRYVSDTGKCIAIKAHLNPDFKKAIAELRCHFHAQGRTLASSARGITRLLGALWTERGDLLIVEEYLSGGNYHELNDKLAKAIGKGIVTHPELLAAIHATALRDAAKGLAETNANSVLHKDIKEENLIFEDGKGRVCDFGISRMDPEAFNEDAIGMGHLARAYHPGFDGDLPALFERGSIDNRTPDSLLQEASAFFKENGVGGPHVRAVMAALSEWDGQDDERLTAANKAYLEASDAVKKGDARWRDLKYAYQDNRS